LKTTFEEKMETETVEQVDVALGQSTLVDYALSEFAVAAQHRDKGQFTPDMLPWIQKIESSVLEMLKVVEDLPKDDRSRWLAVSLLNRLWAFQVITPLTGEEGEWVDSDIEGVKRNRRCPHVFLRADGTAFDAHAVVRMSADGTMRPESVEPRTITFPYMPKQEILGPQDGAGSSETSSGTA
jgi:hypothetical protein